jgi:hypothetical protein
MPTVEEVLTHDERLRLECIAQAVAFNTMKNISPETIVTQARRFEIFIRGTEDAR